MLPYISLGKSHDEVVDNLNHYIEGSKILVKIKTLDNMIRSGRLSVKAGKIAKLINMKPVITLNKEGKGSIEGVAFSDTGALNKTLLHMKKISKEKKILDYSIVHVENKEEAIAFAEKFEAIIGKPPAYIMDTSSVIAIGAGRGAVAISYITE